ncbi:Rab5 [Hexamita inflata]|uniref:Rab5 n=1 Tax=Hexamita inflata TaxID=28002 RepID=A0AA86RIY9_9EUKA|nr:Rab5 [Hexamita inflata]
MNNIVNSNIKLTIVGSLKSGKQYISSYLAGKQYDQQIIGKELNNIELDQFLQLKKLNGKIQIWDSSVLDRFMLIYPFYYNNAKIILVVFNFGDQDSFDKCTDYANYIQNNCSSIVLLVGTRFTDDKIISVDEAIDFAQFNDFQFFELKNDNFDALKTVVQKIVLKVLKN